MDPAVYLCMRPWTGPPVAPYPTPPSTQSHTLFQVANLQKLRDATRAWDHHSDGEGASSSAALGTGGAAALLLLVPPPLDPLDALMPFLEVRVLYVVRVVDETRWMTTD